MEKKKSKPITPIVLLIILAVLALRFIFGGDEDTWICENGKWVKHGRPLVPMPTSECVGDMGGEGNEINELLSGLIKKTEYNFSESEDAKYIWMVSGASIGKETRREQVWVQGKGVKLADAGREQREVIRTYFLDRGLKTDANNVMGGTLSFEEGFSNNDTVCVLTGIDTGFDPENPKAIPTVTGRSNLEVKCGKLILPEKKVEKNTVGFANPASIYCESMGGELRMENDVAGQKGICVFDDGTECEEWDFLRGKCATEHTFCVLNGNELIPGEGMATCVLPDGTECGEFTYYMGDCPEKSE